MALAQFWNVNCVGRVLRVLGIALIGIGAAGYLLPAGAVHWTALIPAALGLLALAASLARNAWIAAALGAVICAVALMGGGSALPQLPALLSGEAGAAIASRASTALAAILALAGIAYALARGRREV
ncbi:hypothetical protein [Falsiroseomonas oryziterrae]|uniref:hypothetical protein n=1 Tax=Falsiroseomonas oryziterrae TaxID=2911368 RepID=UPI001F383390|nr:hypothetical protein [Roseomonas sp. NPKOSM-4]